MSTDFTRPDISMPALVSRTQHRLDRWHHLESVAQQLAAADPASRPAMAETLSTMLDELADQERYWLFPGLNTLTKLRGHLAAGAYDWLSEITTRAVHRLSTFGESGSLFDLEVGLALQDPDARLGSRHFITLLLVDYTTDEIPRSLVGHLRQLEQGRDDIIIGLLLLSTVEDAMNAVASNDEIQACILRHDLRLHEGGPTIAGSGVQCGGWIRELRPRLDLYLLTDESIDSISENYDVFDRTFYRMNEEAELRNTVLAGVRRRIETPYFDALRHYAAAPVGQFHALPVARGASIFNSRWLQDMGEFYGRNIFLAETSSTSGGLDSLLDPHGTLKRALDKAARTWGSQETYFVTNGTSTANKIVVQALTQPGDIVLIDRNCHKSHHYGLVLAGATPLYLDAYPIEDYAIYGAVPLESIKRHLLELKAQGRLDQARMLLLTNCTFDGVTYNVERVMEEVLAIKPDICFLWDEAWYAFATAVPYARQRTAMQNARRLAARLASPAYRELYDADHIDLDTTDLDIDALVHRRLLPDPDRARVRVYATHSTHKSLSALRQGSMIHVWDQDFDRSTRDQFDEAFLTHTSTSPNQQLLASLDLARRQVDLEGFGMVRQAYRMALTFRERINQDPLLSKWFSVLDVEDLIPAKYRPSGLTSCLSSDDARAWAGDEFVLDPTRVTLQVGKTGMNGSEFRQQVLMERFGIQINKTSVNTVLLIFTIGVTWSSVQYLLDALLRTARSLQETADAAGQADRLAQQRRVDALSSTGLPPLPDFSEFDPVFRPTPTSRDGDLRAAFYLTYDANNREYVSLEDALAMTGAGRHLVSANFVVPYPPGFPVLVPGQVVSSAILDFLIHVDVSEIHGYRADLGLCVFTQDAIDAVARGSDDGDRPPAASAAGDGARHTGRSSSSDGSDQPDTSDGSDQPSTGQKARPATKTAAKRGAGTRSGAKLTSG